MKKSSLLILIMVCSLSSVIAQRVIDYAFAVLAPNYGAGNFKGVSVGDNAYIAAVEAFYKFDGTSTVRYDYPVRDGVQLSISHAYGGTNMDTWTLDHNRALPALNSVIYLNLTNQVTAGCHPCTHFLYQFYDGLITPSPITDPVLSNVAVFQNRVYAVVKSVDGSARLISFDGSTVTDVITSLEFNNVLALFATDQYLYIADHKFNGPGVSNTDVFIKRFDGSMVIDIPSFDLPTSFVREVYQLPGVEEVYFHSETDITRFDGSTVTEIAEAPYLDHMELAVFENMIYFTIWDVPGVPILYRNDGTTTEVVALPGGAQIIGSPNSLLIYDGNLFIACYSPSGGILYRYDGTSFTPFEIGDVGFAYTNGLYERDGKLLVNSFESSYEYYRGGICTINSNNFYPRTNLSTDAFHVWWRNTRVGEEEYVEYGIERKTGCGGSTIIPARLVDFESVEIMGNALERDWCWTGIDVDWIIDPYCPTPPICFDQLFQISMTDSSNKLAFQKEFDKPTEISIPLVDQQSYDLSLDLWSSNNKSFENILTIDEELVPLGLSGISLSMKPKDGRIFIDALTDKGKEVPFQITLLNEDGEALWQESFVAPLKKEITGMVEKPGASLRLSATVPLENKGEKTEWKVNYYPNPFTNKITVEFDPDSESHVNFAIYSMQGDLVQYKMMKSTGSYTLEIDPKNRQGLYILSIRRGNKELRKLIELRYAK